jgi:outer membrane protein assembly complex protein YaeT
MVRVRWFSFLVLSALSVPAEGQTTAARFTGRHVTAVEFSPSPMLDPADLARVQTIHPGDSLNSGAVAAAIDALFATGRFENIRVEGESQGSGVLVRFVVTPRTFVGGVEIAGKIGAPPNRGEMRSFTQLNLGAPIEDIDVSNAASSIQRLLEANGMHGSTVTPETQQGKDAQQVFLTFRVKETKRERYEHPVVEGETLLSDDVLLRATGWRFPIIHIWRQVTGSRTRGGVQGLLNKYGSQNRLEAQVDLKEVEYDTATKRVRPHLAVNPGPEVLVRTQEAKVSKRVLKRYLPLYQERSVSPELLLEGKRNLEDYFQSQGYYDVEVDFRLEPATDDQQVIDYAISKGVRRKVARVNVTGNRYFDTNTLRERMFIQPAAFTVRHGRFSEAFRKKDEENIADLYRSNGFRDVTVTTATVDGSGPNAGSLTVNVSIAEGPQWVVERVEFEGFSQIRPEEIEGGLASAANQPFSEVNLAQDRNEILTYYFSHGFPAAKLDARWRPGLQPNRVVVIYTVDEGQRQYVRDLLITGTHITRPSLIQKHLTLKAGDPLSPVEQSSIQHELYNLGIFARVETAIENPDGDETHKFILYNIDESDRYRLNIGVGAQVARFGTPSSTSLASPAGTTGFSPQFSLDVSRLNFMGRGHTVSLRTMYSSIEKRAAISYLQPRFHNVEGRNITYTVLYENTLDVRTFASKREEASVQVSQIFSKSLTGLFGFSFRRVSVSDVIIPVLLVPALVQPVRLGILTANLVQDRRDNRTNPTRGMYNTLDLGFAHKYLGSQRDFVRALGRNATYYRLRRGLVLARQTQFGIIAPFSIPPDLTHAEAIPLPERFFGGGADSLRSFSYNQAGPRDTGAPVVPGGPASSPTGFPLGGNALLFNNVELRFPLIGENIQGVFFHDMGNVYGTFQHISFRYHQRDLTDFDYMTHAVGFGIRYRTPLGPIRADLAYSLNPPAFNGFSGTPQQLLQCDPSKDPASNPSFCQPSQQRISHFQFFFSIGQTF